ncbi:tetratricopeptide repeat protein [Pseudomonas nitroreducens]|uniref:Tetratricopeptide repeat protein n=1 Tax=Pseudomonas nitroreducens TaxID=46680 RepID=A0A5R9A4P5_PSENT|nr:tetratricopeptide repeat protein [Pseudomonas nitroreducens]TLP73679.1 tetratricopeptide repeat protein [Pseudomonas nitroreducens]
MRIRKILFPCSLLFTMLGSAEVLSASTDKALSLFEAEQYQASIHEADRVLEATPDDSEALNIKALSVSVLGDDNTAIRLVSEALEASRKTGKASIEQQANYWNNLGYFNERQRNFQLALGYYRKSLEMRLAAYGESDLRTADSYNNLGTTLSKLGQFDEGFAYLRKNLTLRERLLGADHHQVAVAINNLGNAYNLQGDYESSLPLFQRALQIDTRLYGPQHPILAVRWNNIGDALRGLGRYDEAALFLNRALASDLATFGENHPKLVLRYFNLARLYEAQGDVSRSGDAYANALRIQRQVNPGDTEQIQFLESKLGTAAAVSAAGK